MAALETVHPSAMEKLEAVVEDSLVQVLLQKPLVLEVFVLRRR